MYHWQGSDAAPVKQRNNKLLKRNRLRQPENVKGDFFVMLKPHAIKGGIVRRDRYFRHLPVQYIFAIRQAVGGKNLYFKKSALPFSSKMVGEQRIELVVRSDKRPITHAGSKRQSRYLPACIQHGIIHFIRFNAGRMGDGMV